MIDPAPALVRPRVVGRDGEFRPLEDVIDKLLSQGGSLCETVQVIDAGLSIRRRSDRM